MEKVNLRNEKFKGTRDITKFSFVKDLTYGYSWPQRNNYKCSFCKKEFKSAQALGGHMNVHRRDRAKMRLSPSWDNNILKQNPNPNSSSTHHPPSSPMSRFLPSMAYKSSFTEISSPSSASIDDKNLPIVARSLRDPMNPRRGDIVKNLNEGAFLQLGELTGFAKRSGFRVSKKKEMVTLDFDIDLLQDAKEELDLELRLGYS